MDLARSIYSRDLKIATMRALDAGSTISEIARKYQLSPKLLERWRRIAELERKIGQFTRENDFLKKALQHFRDHHRPAVVNGGDACLKKSNKPRRKAKP